jgi:hypothetical protein
MKNRKITLIFDLDETVINSAHRTPNFPDGTLNLAAYMELHTAENVAKDTLLPLAKVMQDAIKNGYKVAILTARDMMQADYDFLAANGIKPRHIYSRDKCKTKKHYKMRDGEYKATWFAKMPKSLTNNHCIMFDDAKPVKTAMRAIGVVCLCAHKVNKKMYLSAKDGF